MARQKITSYITYQEVQNPAQRCSPTEGFVLNDFFFDEELDTSEIETLESFDSCDALFTEENIIYNTTEKENYARKGTSHSNDRHVDSVKNHSQEEYLDCSKVRTYYEYKQTENTIYYMNPMFSTSEVSRSASSYCNDDKHLIPEKNDNHITKDKEKGQ